jgi:hypothetical protein
MDEIEAHLEVADKVFDKILISHPLYLRWRRRFIAHWRNIVFMDEARVPDQAVVIAYW